MTIPQMGIRVVAITMIGVSIAIANMFSWSMSIYDIVILAAIAWLLTLTLDKYFVAAQVKDIMKEKYIHITFYLCARCKLAYNALILRPDLPLKYCVLPYYIFFWDDEHPLGTIPWSCSPMCRDSILNLIAARTNYWVDSQIPTYYLNMWSEAQSQIPQWPGFQRLTLGSQDLSNVQNVLDGHIGDFFSISISELRTQNRIDLIATKIIAFSKPLSP